eukprot:Em0017g245a
MWQYVQEPEEETVRALARRCGSTHRDLGRRQSGHWPGDVAVCTGTWGGDSQDTGQEMWQYSQGPGEETVRALARRCGSMYRNLGRRQSGHWPGNVAVLTRTWGGDSQGTGQEMWQYSQGSGEETVRALARRYGSMHRDLGRRQSGHWPGDVAVCTGTWGGDSQDTGQEMWQYSQGPGEETVRALARRCGSTHRDLGRRQSGPWPVDVTVLSDLGRRQSGHWPGDVTGLTGTSGGDSQTGKNCLRCWSALRYTGVRSGIRFTMLKSEAEKTETTTEENADDALKLACRVESAQKQLHRLKHSEAASATETKGESTNCFKSVGDQDERADKIEVLSRQIRQLSEEMEKMSAPKRSEQWPTGSKDVLCWTCGGQGHIRRNCPKRKEQRYFGSNIGKQFEHGNRGKKPH